MEYKQKTGEWFKVNRDKMMIGPNAGGNLKLYASNTADGRVATSDLEASPLVASVGEIAAPTTIKDIVEGTWFIAVDTTGKTHCNIMI